MKMSDGVEWAVHCALLLAALPASCRLSGRALAEFHGVKESYLLKHLHALVQAGILDSLPGPKGGFGLAKNAEDISLFDIVQAVDGGAPFFRCSEIRQRGPCALDDTNAYRRPCGVNRAMLRAEAQYHLALKAETIKVLLIDFASSADPRILAQGKDWAERNLRTRAT